MTLREGEAGDGTTGVGSGVEGLDMPLDVPVDGSVDVPVDEGLRGARIRTVDVSTGATVEPTLGPVSGVRARPAAAVLVGSTAPGVAPVLPPPPPWVDGSPGTPPGTPAGTHVDAAGDAAVDSAGAIVSVTPDAVGDGAPPAPVVAAVPAGRSRRRWIGRGAIAAGLVLVLGVGAVAVYDNLNGDVVLPGVTVEGRDVGGRSIDAARAEIAEIVARNGTRTVAVQVPGEADQPVALADLGLDADVDRAVDAVRSGDVDGGSPSTLDTITAPFVRTYHRLTNTPVAADVAIDYSFPEEKIQEYVAATAARLDRPAVDAAIDVSSGRFVLNKEQVGRKLDAATAATLFRDNADTWATSDAPAAVPLPVEVLNPGVTEQSLGTTLFVNRSTNKLYHYDGSQLVREYNVSVGTPDHPTPRGTFKITHMRKNPTWINPAKGGWGNGMPARIGPGPDNPLGTRAMNLNASGIRIHGTKAVGRLGSAASHGCIRMAMPEVEELFDRVKVDTRVIIV